MSERIELTKQDLVKQEKCMEEVRAIFPAAKAARDGWSRELGFEEDE